MVRGSRCTIPHLESSVSSSLPANPLVILLLSHIGKKDYYCYFRNVMSYWQLMQNHTDNFPILLVNNRTLVLVLGATVHLMQCSRLWITVFSVRLCKMRQHGSRFCFPTTTLVIQLHPMTWSFARLEQTKFMQAGQDTVANFVPSKTVSKPIQNVCVH